MDQHYFLNLFCVTGLQMYLGTTLAHRRSCQNKALYISTLLPIDLMQFLADSTEQKASSSGQVLPVPSGKKMRLITFFSLLLSLGGLAGLGW
jgi:hypothetical protein